MNSPHPEVGGAVPPTWQLIDTFAAAIADAGLGNPAVIADGRIHRYHADGRKGAGPEWYVLFLDRIPAGSFGSWKQGCLHTWCSRDRATLTPREQADIRALLDQARRQHQAEREQQYRLAAQRAAYLWGQCAPAPGDHKYLVTKVIRPHHARIDRRGWLVIPATDGTAITTLQFIAPDGTKRFLPGGRISSCWSVIDGEKPGPVLIGEGFATGASLREQTGCPVVVAFNAGNLLPVAKVIRRMNPRDEIIVCGDDDQWTPGNPGRTKAREAALEIGAKLLMPDFAGFDLATRPTDWNDWYRLRLVREVAR